jgi:type II secretory pathway component PulJ
LIEMLAVVGFTAVLMLFAVNFYLEITRAAEAATERTRDSRRAVAVLDRIARDLGAAVLVKKPAEVDPLSHPWVFLAEDRGGAEGAEHLRFTTRSRILRSTALHESDLEVVSYALREAEDGGLELLRWSSPRLPDELDRSFPASEIEDAVLFAEDLAAFGVRFMDDLGEWNSEWDSSTLVDSSELPLAAEISVAILPENDPFGEEEPQIYQRRVLLPMRPLDMEALLGGEEPEDGDENGCEGMTVGACLNLPENVDTFEQLQEKEPEDAAEIYQVLDDCFSDHRQLFDGMDLVGCQ